MKLGKITVRRSYKPSRIICDVISLAGTAVILYLTEHFINGENIVRENIPAALVFPALAIAILAVYAVLTLKNHAFRGYEITKNNAQKIYDWYAFSVSLVKLPALLIVFESMLTFQEITLGIAVNLLNLRLLLYAVMIAVIIRMAVHRMKTLAKKDIVSDAARVRAVVVDENDEKEKK